MPIRCQPLRRIVTCPPSVRRRWARDRSSSVSLKAACRCTSSESHDTIAVIVLRRAADPGRMPMSALQMSSATSPMPVSQFPNSRHAEIQRLGRPSSSKFLFTPALKTSLCIAATLLLVPCTRAALLAPATSSAPVTSRAHTQSSVNVPSATWRGSRTSDGPVSTVGSVARSGPGGAAAS